MAFYGGLPTFVVGNSPTSNKAIQMSSAKVGMNFPSPYQASNKNRDLALLMPSPLTGARALQAQNSAHNLFGGSTKGSNVAAAGPTCGSVTPVN